MTELIEALRLELAAAVIEFEAAIEHDADPEHIEFSGGYAAGLRRALKLAQ
jgi:hypothetical protein